MKLVLSFLIYQFRTILLILRGKDLTTLTYRLVLNTLIYLSIVILINITSIFIVVFYFKWNHVPSFSIKLNKSVAFVHVVKLESWCVYGHLRSNVEFLWFLHLADYAV